MAKKGKERNIMQTLQYYKINSRGVDHRGEPIQHLYRGPAIHWTTQH